MIHLQSHEKGMIMHSAFKMHPKSVMRSFSVSANTKQGGEGIVNRSNHTL